MVAQKFISIAFATAFSAMAFPVVAQQCTTIPRVYGHPEYGMRIQCFNSAPSVPAPQVTTDTSIYGQFMPRMLSPQEAQQQALQNELLRLQIEQMRQQQMGR